MPERATRARPAPPHSPRVARRRGILASAVLVVCLVGFLAVFVYPTRTYVRQRQQTAQARAELQVLRREAARLEADSARVQGDAEIERIARERYGLVRPGETTYVIVPATSP